MCGIFTGLVAMEVVCLLNLTRNGINLLPETLCMVAYCIMEYVVRLDVRSLAIGGFDQYK